MNLFDEMYVAISGGEAPNTTSFPLAFMVPEGNDSASRKRKETATGWAQPARMSWDPVKKHHVPNGVPLYVGSTFKNEPTDGFEFDKVVSRWSTSNKVFQINDPRGFSLQISAANLADLVNNTSIVNGRIQSKLLWTRYGGDNWLTRLDHPDYLKNVNPAFTRAPIIGDLIETGYENQVVYIGDYFINTVEKVMLYFDPNKNEWTKKYSHRYGYNTQKKEVLEVTIDDKPWKILASYDKKTGAVGDSISTLRKFGKFNIIDENIDISGITLPVGKLSKSGYKTAPDLSFSGNCFGYGTTFRIHKTKAEAKADNISEKDFIS